MQEKRKHNRFIVEGMDIQCRMLFATEVKLLDISISGASILTKKRLNIGSRYSLKVEGDEGDPFSLHGVIIWEQLSGSEKNSRNEVAPIYKAGIKFDDVLTGKGAELIEFIQENSLKDYHRARIAGLRVRIHSDKAVLGYRQTFEALRISRGGALIETSEELEAESRFMMEILLPEDEEPVRFLGRIANCNAVAGKSPAVYKVGIEFLEIDENDVPKLTEFIDSIETA